MRVRATGVCRTPSCSNQPAGSMCVCQARKVYCDTGRDLPTEGLHFGACKQPSGLLMMTGGRWCRAYLAVMSLCPAGVGLLVNHPKSCICRLTCCRHAVKSDHSYLTQLRSICGLSGCKHCCCCCCSCCLGSILQGSDMPGAAPSLSSANSHAAQ